MSRDDDKGWDTGLSRFLDAERRNVTAPDDAEERVWGRVAAGIGGFGGSGGSGGGGTGDGGKSSAGARARAASGEVSPKPGRWLASNPGILAVYALGVATGIVGSVLASHATSRGYASNPRVDRVETVAVDREVVPMPVAVALSGTADAAPSPPATSVGARPPMATVGPATVRTLEEERVLLDVARTSLGRGDGAGAMRAITAHEQRYPQGLLAEEREAIAIQALLLIPSFEDARRREAAFERQYPHSMLLQAVRASVQSIP